MNHGRGIVEWAEELKYIWNEHSTVIEEQVGVGRTRPFVQSLTSLLNTLERTPLHADEQEVEQAAWRVYNAWNNMGEWSEKYERGENGSVPIGGHTLPPLTYSYDALEPYIDAEIMRLHHDKHHQSYVDGLNKAEIKMQEARETGNYELIKHWEREAAFHGAGHYLHSIFWEVMNPNGGGIPGGELLEAIERDFGSFEKMQEHFAASANAVEGSGWTMLVWSPRARRLEILQAEKHQNLSQQDQVPLLVLDMWEHAYYLQYKNERKPYISNWWNVVNWPEVEARFDQARQLKWEPY
ncbi:superoxide dismutase [Bacillus sp. FJAT-45037]|uniref:superoxide dismutase n=1 Tax=Bacillus sp. FJAT-45037 TaxID=2011007 RepID=UPI000C240333|nr:superoxide dismutase [Bacillus sp. FJAT-45037]